MGPAQAFCANECSTNLPEPEQSFTKGTGLSRRKIEHEEDPSANLERFYEVSRRPPGSTKAGSSSAIFGARAFLPLLVHSPFSADTLLLGEMRDRMCGMTP